MSGREYENDYQASLGDDDSDKPVSEVNVEDGRDDNDMGEFAVDARRHYLDILDSVCISCHALIAATWALMGIGLARIELRPMTALSSYRLMKWMYAATIGRNLLAWL